MSYLRIRCVVEMCRLLRRFAFLIVGAICLSCGSQRALAVDESEPVTLRIRFGLKDQQPTDWAGKLVTSKGKVEAIRGWRWNEEDSAAENSWSVKTRRTLPQSAADRKRIAAGQALAMTDNGIIVTLRGCSADEKLTFESQPARGEFRLDQLKYGQGLRLADGAVFVERVPSVGVVSATQMDEDYPSVAVSKDGTTYATYLAFTRGRDFQGPVSVWRRRSRGQLPTWTRPYARSINLVTWRIWLNLRVANSCI